MAKGDKKKKNGRSTPEVSFSKSANCSTSSIGSEPIVDEESGQAGELLSGSDNSVVSQPPLIEKHEPSDGEFYEVPVLSKIIVQRYEGGKCREMFHGEGIAHFQGGHVYKGMFSEGLMHGRGVYTWADGVKYQGEFASNVPMGHGIYTWLDGSCYEGEVCNGIRHGVGTYKCAKTSVIYRGQWHHGKRHGKGTIYYNQEVTSWYEGDWINNSREGWGVRCYPSGNIYEGQWRNNGRHGEGRMRWLQLGQQYNGKWENGIQHGQGTHTWFLRRVPGSQYPLRNEYSGEFVQGLRHGQGKFDYASGAVYKGEWKSNKKHGQGKFIFKNGRMFEGEFVDDHMAEFPAFSIDGSKTPDISGIRTHTPPLREGDSPRRTVESSSGSVLLGPDMALDIQTLLASLPEAHRDLELKQVEFAVLRHIAELRAIYSFYSSLGHDQSPDNTFLMSRLQFWRLLKDCNVHQHGITLAQMDRLICEDVPEFPEEIHSPFTTMLLRKFLSCIVILAYNIFHKEIESSNTSNTLVVCFSKLMTHNIIPNAKNVKGPLFCNPLRAVIAVNYIERCWEIHQAFCRVNSTALSDLTMNVRHFIWMFKDLCLYDDKLTTRKVLEILSVENPAVYSTVHSNLDLEMTFLEFFEALLGCAEAKGRQEIKASLESLYEMCGQAEVVRASPGEKNGPTVKSSNPYISPDVGSAKSLEKGKSKEILQLSTPEEMERTQSSKSTVNFKTLTGDGLQCVSGLGSAPLAAATSPAKTDQCQVNPASDPTVCWESAVVSKAANPARPPSTGTEPAEEGEAEPEGELEHWIQRTHLFFSQTFFPAYDYSLLLRTEVHKERLRQAAKARIALAKAKEEARRRELWEGEEEERRREEEEEEEAERGNGLDDEVNPSSPALVTPVASATSVVAPKQSPASGSKKKKK